VESNRPRMREPIVPQLDAEEFLHWEARQRDRYELRHGFVLAFAGGTADHATIALNLSVALRRAFPLPCRVFGSDLKIAIGSNTFYYADAAVTCREIAGTETFVSAPLVICEVLSDSTRRYDAVEKRAAYRTVPSLERLIIVDTQIRRLEVDMCATNGWETSIVESGVVPLGSTHVALADIYVGTSLAELH